MELELTARQEEIYSMILDFIEEHGYPPTVREIQAVFRLASPNGVVCHLEALAKKGWIKWANGQARAISLVHDKVTVVRNSSVGKRGRMQLSGPYLPVPPNGASS